ncbi:unnamed protein product [Nezara viridula]|uniref:Uncharacterized protein n=1 Tax=Nezara viridula TaxID=85310 RepID=A0A9P0HEC8_NEZVI|nr:unnamed protein product [Nezara viridula]
MSLGNLWPDKSVILPRLADKGEGQQASDSDISQSTSVQSALLFFLLMSKPSIQLYVSTVTQLRGSCYLYPGELFDFFSVFLQK